MWTYKFDRFDPTVTKDTSTVGRFTFKRYLYYEPDIYDTWKMNAPLSSIPYTAEIISQLPSLYTRLSGSLSSFYLYDYEEIINMNAEDNPQAASYGVATLLYENIPADNGSNNDESESSDQKYQNGEARTLAPWQQAVRDFSATPYTYEESWISGYVRPAVNGSNYSTMELVRNRALQGYKNLNVTKYGMKYTWTYYTNDSTEDYSKTLPIINTDTFTIGNTAVTLSPYTALLLPPVRKILFHNDSKTKTSTKYYAWSFEIHQLFKDWGQGTTLYNAGTRAYFNVGSPPSAVIKDICSWYVSTPSGTAPIQRQYGYFDEMVAAKKQVDVYNTTVSDQLQKKQFVGDFVKDPIPLDLSGYIDTSALNGTTPKYTLTFWKYPFDSFYGEVGWRSADEEN